MKRRFPVAVLAATLFCLVSLSSAPTTSSVVAHPAMTTLPSASGLGPNSSQEQALDSANIASPATSAEMAEIQRRIVSTLPYGSIIARSAERNRIDTLLLAAVVEVESGFTAEAISAQGARGLMQVKPSTANAVGHKGDLLDPHTNIDVGSRYLVNLLHDFNGNVELSLAAYNAGPSAVLRHNGIPPYRETRAYVKKVMSRYQDLRREATSIEAVYPATLGFSR